MLSSLLVGGAVALDLTIFTLPGEAGGGTWYATQSSNPGLADPRQVCYPHV